MIEELVIESLRAPGHNHAAIKCGYAHERAKKRLGKTKAEREQAMIVEQERRAKIDEEFPIWMKEYHHDPRDDLKKELRKIRSKLGFKDIHATSDHLDEMLLRKADAEAMKKDIEEQASKES